jgi:hypothetical protein
MAAIGARVRALPAPTRISGATTTTEWEPIDGYWPSHSVARHDLASSA